MNKFRMHCEDVYFQFKDEIDNEVEKIKKEIIINSKLNSDPILT
jgi:hypothetical protein